MLRRDPIVLETWITSAGVPQATTAWTTRCYGLEIKKTLVKYPYLTFMNVALQTQEEMGKPFCMNTESLFISYCVCNAI